MTWIWPEPPWAMERRDTFLARRTLRAWWRRCALFWVGPRMSERVIEPSRGKSRPRSYALQSIKISGRIALGDLGARDFAADFSPSPAPAWGLGAGEPLTSRGGCAVRYAMPRDGALTLSDLRQPTLSIVWRALRSARALQRGEAHGTVRRREADRSACDARRLPEGALGQHPRQVQGGVRAAAAVSSLACKSRRMAA